MRRLPCHRPWGYQTRFAEIFQAFPADDSEAVNGIFWEKLRQGAVGRHQGAVPDSAAWDGAPGWRKWEERILAVEYKQSTALPF